MGQALRNAMRCDQLVLCLFLNVPGIIALALIIPGHYLTCLNNSLIIIWVI